MAPRETPKATPQVQRAISKTKSSPMKPKGSMIKKQVQTSLLRGNNIKSAVQPQTTTAANKPKENKVPIQLRTRTKSDPQATPKGKENKIALPPSASKSAKKPVWQRKPKPAHSGVPVPEKMKKIMLSIGDGILI